MKRLSLLIALASAAALPRAAHADTCDSLVGKDPTDTAPNVYMQVGDTQVNLMKRLGNKLRDSTHPVRIVFFTNPSCTNIAAIYGQTAITAGLTMQYLPSKKEDGAWTPDKPTLT